MANGTTGLMGKSYGSSVVGPGGLFGSVSDFEKSFTFAQRPEGMGITPQEMQNKARLLQEQQERKNFFQRQGERDEFQKFKREQEKQARKQRFLQGQAQEQARTGAIQGLQDLYASYTVFGEPGQAGIDDVRSYIQRNIASGNFNQDDIPGVIFNFATNKPQQGELQRLREASTGQALNPFGNIPAAPRPAPQSSIPAGALRQRGDSLFGSEGQFLGTYGGPSGNTFTPGLTNVDQMRMDRLNTQGALQSRIDELAIRNQGKLPTVSF